MKLELINALQFTQWLLAAGLALQAVESLVARRTFGCAMVFGLRLVLCGALGFVPPVSSAAALVHGLLLATSMLLVARLRGPLCGGSDAMWFQVQVGLLLASLAGWHPALARVGLGWIAAQSVLSYLLAGMVKLRNANWRSGEALRQLLASDGPYVIWAPARRLAGDAGICAVLAWAVIAFELLFPLVLVVPVDWRWAWLLAGLVFHAGNAVLLGLNRFAWAWATTYPALVAF